MSVPVKRKRPRPGPKRHFKPEVLQMNEIHSYQKALRELVKSGGVSDPEMIARIESGWHPGIELAVMSCRTDLADPIRTVILKVLLENSVVSATDKARLEAAVDSPTSINISIASWAAGQGPKAIEHQPVDRAPVIDVVATDAELRAHRSSPPQPEPTEPAYQEMEMRPDGGGVLRPAPIEPVESDGWKPKRYVYNSDSGLYDVEEG